MKLRLLLLFVSLLTFGAVGLPCRAHAADSPIRGMQIDPATTGVPLGKARLSIEPLMRTPGKDGLNAGYKVDVTPFSSKSEMGRFSVAISDADLHRLASGEAIHFTGQAISRDGNNSTVEGRATPTAGGNNGALRIQVASPKGKLVFHTTYHLRP